MKITRARCASLLLAAAPTWAMAQSDACGSLANGNFGPLDYRLERHNALRIVEQNHFAPQVEALLSGQTGALGADLDFVLRASPNHHRALEALVRLRSRPELLAKSQLPRTIECYFDRALRFRPDDHTSRLLYVTMLLKEGRKERAVQELERVRNAAGDNPFTRYNLGLLYLDAGMPAEALAEAHKAMALGFIRPELRARLIAAGQWREPDKSADAAADPSPPASAASQ